MSALPKLVAILAAVSLAVSQASAPLGAGSRGELRVTAKAVEDRGDVALDLKAEWDKVPGARTYRIVQDPGGRQQVLCTTRQTRCALGNLPKDKEHRIGLEVQGPESSGFVAVVTIAALVGAGLIVGGAIVAKKPYETDNSPPQRSAPAPPQETGDF